MVKQKNRDMKKVLKQYVVEILIKKFSEFVLRVKVLLERRVG